jgi:hypothetical protein
MATGSLYHFSVCPVDYALPLQLPSQTLFYAAQDVAGDSNTGRQVDVESAYYRQPALLKHEIVRAAAATAGRYRSIFSICRRRR